MLRRYCDTLRHFVGVIALSALLACCASAGPAAVDRDEYVPVDGAQLYMAIRGDDSRLPLMIWLHGGPGGAERPLFQLYNSPLEHHLIVAYLDQRGTARSFDPKADPHKLTIARHLEDLDVVVDHLRREFFKRKVILVGHSWGSALGLLYAQAHPDKVAAFVGVGQVTSELARQKSQYQFVELQARQHGDSDASAQLQKIGPPPFSAKQEIAMQHLVQRFGGYWRDRPNFALLVLRGMVHGFVMPWELPHIFEGNNVSLAAMNDELLKLDLRARVPSVQVPVIFMLGRYDRQVDSRLAAAFLKDLVAPEKRLKWFEKSAHNIPFEQPDAFNAALPKLLADVGAIPQMPGGAGNTGAAIPSISDQ